MRPSRILLGYAALAVFTAFYPALRGQLPAPAGSALQLLPDARAPRERNDELSDVATQFLPWSTAVAEAYRAGRLPFRFDANGCGTPLWANPVAQAVTPTTVFFLILPLAWASASAAAVKLFLAAAGVFVFLRRRGLSPVAASWAGLAFGYTIFFTAWMHFPQTWPQALLPWALWALDRVARGERGGFRASLGVVALLLAGGYPEGELFTAVAGVVYFAAVLLSQKTDAATRWRRLGIASAASLLALGLTAAYTLPATIAIARGERSVQAARGSAAAAPEKLAARDFLRPPIYWNAARFWVVPEAQGNPRDRDKFGLYSFAGRASGYPGILVLAFALGAYFWRRPPRPVVWARVALVLVGLYVLWYPPLVKVLQGTPLLREVAFRLTTNRANGIALVLLGLLAAFQLDRIRAGRGRLAMVAGLAIAFAATVVVFVEHLNSPGRAPLTLGHARALSFAVPALLLGAALVMTIRRTSGRAMAILLIAGTAVDLLRIGARFNPGTRPEDWYPVTPEVRRLQEASRGGRFAADSIALTGFAVMYGLEDVRVHDPVAPADYEDALRAAAGYTGPEEYAARVTRLDAPILEFLNARARLGPGGEIRRSEARAASLPERLAGCRDEAQVLERLAAASDLVSTAYAVGPDESFQGAAEIRSVASPSPEEIRVDLHAEAPRLLVLPVSDDGGWTATAGVGRLPTLRVHHAFLGVRIGAGETTVVCRYTPPGFRTGLIATGISALAILALVAARRRFPSEEVGDRVGVIGQKR